MECSVSRRLGRTTRRWQTAGAWLGVLAWFALTIGHPFAHACQFESTCDHPLLASSQAEVSDSCLLCTAAHAPALTAAPATLPIAVPADAVLAIPAERCHGVAAARPTVRGPPTAGC